MAETAAKTPARGAGKTETAPAAPAARRPGAPKGPRRDWTREYAAILSRVDAARHGTTGKVQEELAKQYGVSVQTIQNVVRKARGGARGRVGRRAAAPVTRVTGSASSGAGSVARFDPRSIETLTDTQLGELASAVKVEVQKRIGRLKALEKMLG